MTDPLYPTYDGVFQHYLDVTAELKKNATSILKTDCYNEAHRDPIFTDSSAQLIEYDQDCITKALSLHPKLKIVKGDIRNIPFPDKSYDLILDLSTIDHVSPEDFDGVIDEYNRLLKDGGKLLLITWFTEHEVPKVEWNPSNQYYFNYNKVKEKLSSLFTIESESVLFKRHDAVVESCTLQEFILIKTTSVQKVKKPLNAPSFRDDDVLYYPEVGIELAITDYMERFINVHNLFKKYGVQHEVAILANGIDKNMAWVNYMKGEDLNIQLHGWEHIDYTLHHDKFKDDTQKAIAKIKEAFGVVPTVWFPPWNKSDNFLDEVAHGLGLEVSFNKVTVNDWVSDPKDNVVINFHYWADCDTRNLEKALQIYKQKYG